MAKSGRPRSDKAVHGVPVNRAEMARIFGITPPALDDWRHKGMPCESADGSREITFHTRDAIDWFAAREVEKVTAAQTDTDGIQTDEAKRRSAVARMIVDEIDADIALKNAVLVSDMLDIVRTEYATLRQTLMQIGAKIADKACTMTVPGEIQELVETEIAKALNLLKADHERQ